MKTNLYIEPFSGISGDMFLSAMCALGDGFGDIVELPAKLGLREAKVEVQELNKNGIVCRHVNIIDLSTSREDGAHGHSSNPHHGHAHRHLSDIVDIIEKGAISENAKRIAIEIFRIIGVSESRIHDIPLEKIHFHEVSGVDSILDIVGAALMIDRLDIGKVYSDAICVGSGMVKTQHGLLPVPAPATADILKGMPTYRGSEEGERTTPTGAAILRYLDPEFAPAKSPVKDIAYGPGTKDFEGANVLRISTLVGDRSGDEVFVVETNIDDAPSEMIGADFQESLLGLGALDVFLTPIIMKKGRSAVMLSAIVPAAAFDEVCDCILDRTTSIGLRSYPVNRRTLERRTYEAKTEFGIVAVKEVTRPSGDSTRKVEYESLLRLSEETGLSLPVINDRILSSLKERPANVIPSSS